MRPLIVILSLGLNLLPHRVIQAIGKILGWTMHSLFRFRIDEVSKNVNDALGNQFTAEQRNLIVRKNYDHYGKTILEVLRTVCWSPKKYRERIKVHGLENVTQFTVRGRGVFLLTLHLGNWEVALCTVAANGLPFDVVVKQTRNRWTESFLNWSRRRTGARIFFESGTAKDILKALGQGRCVAFILDQFMGPPAGIPVKFFGKLAGTAAGVALISEKRDVPVIPAYSHRDEEGFLHVCFDPPVEYPPLSESLDERIYQKTQAYNQTLEAIIRRYPDQWMWLHRRWKPYIGIPKWRLATASSLGALLLWLVGCTSPGNPTGIEFPPEPAVATPQYLPPTPMPDISSSLPQVEAPPKGALSKQSKKVKKEDGPKERYKFVTFPPEKIPFEPGERMELDLTWMALPAGRAVLEVREKTETDGRPTFHLWGNVLSSRLVDTIYHVDNTIESFIDREGLLPYKFLLHMLETAQKKETRVRFDHPKGKALYWSKRVSARWGNEDQDRTDDFVPGAKDMFSALYYARVLDYQLNQKNVVWVYENRQNLEISVLPVANELVRTPAGVFQCWKLQLTAMLNNVLKPTGDLFLWLSDDAKRYIVKFDAKIKIGSLIGSLVKLRERT